MISITTDVNNNLLLYIAPPRGGDGRGRHRSRGAPYASVYSLQVSTWYRVDNSVACSM